ncbi:MAG TPA: hypothetical protein VFD03_01870 [Clostridia bacterium]|nr:hypothetical protein [Clostridia bacterium]
MTWTTRILNGIYVLIIILFLLDSLTSFDIKSQLLKTFVYLGLLIGTPLTLTWNFFVLKTKNRKIFGTVFPTIILIFILIVGPLKIIFSTSAWQTKTILYTNGHFSFKTIEFQTQDMGALGYNKRTVEVLYLTDFFMIINEIPLEIDKKVEWIKVDKEIKIENHFQ